MDSITNTSLFIDNTEIKLMDTTANQFLNRLTVIFGSSNSGKSTILLDILFKLKNYIPNIIVINPTNANNNSYSDIVPNGLIHSKVTKELLDDIFQKQDVAKCMFNIVHDIDLLLSLFYKFCSYDEQIKIKNIIKLFEQTKINIENSNEHFTDKRIKKDKAEKLHNNFLITDLHRFLKINKLKIIENKNKLDDNDIIILKYLNFNPNFILILDDCGASIKEWGKFPQTRDLFFNGRHRNITTIITLQDDKILDTELRKNIHISMFTTSNCTNAFFTRSANNFNKSEQKKILFITEELFKNNKKKGKNYKKLCYLKDDPDGNIFQYLIADIHNNFKFGTKLLHELCNQTKKNDNNKLEHNKFTEAFL